MSTPPLHRDDVQRFLHGYSFLEWPDLSATRRPRDITHTTQCLLGFSQSDRVPHILLAISRILGAYCGASDVLIAVETDEPDCFTFVRVSWTDSDTWNEVLQTICPQLNSRVPITLSTIRKTLDLNNKQSPCMAVYCSFIDSRNSIQEYPLTFTYNAIERELSLSSSLKHTHPSVSSQILHQVALTVEHINAQPMTTISCTYLPSELMSECERTRDEESLAVAYPRVPAMPFSTDYLKYRSISHPTSTSIQWYPDLSPGKSLQEFDSVSYLIFHRKANQTARWLRKMGLETEDRVAVCMPRDVLFHVAMMGIMRAGGCYVPIDPDLPSERKAYIARDSDARFVITTSCTSPPSLFGSRTIFFEDAVVQAAVKEELHHDVNLATVDGLAFLLYTSGTTGNPKGCLLTHRGLSQAIVALSSAAADVHMSDLTQGRYLAVASVAFDVHLAETFVPIALGMPLLSAPRSQLLENLPFYVKQLNITHLGIVPSLIEATLGAVSEANGGRDMALRYIASGGEKMSDAILDKWVDHPKVRLGNFYGPSEATIGCCARYMDPETPRANIGRSFANVAGYVVDINLNILPRGSIGELVIEGPLVGRGYFGRPDLTEKVFIEWPKQGDWAYRTGDLVRMMPDLTFEILGRIDSQIKLRGVRIESEGISSIIRRATSSSPLDATTILGKHPSIGIEQLVSFVAWDLSVTVSTRKSQKPFLKLPPSGLMDRIKDMCEVELPRYMRPSHIIPLSWLPLSSNGKSDVKVLAAIFNSLDISSLAEVMAGMYQQTRPATETEKRIFHILRRHATVTLPMPLPELSVFSCGLDSMAVIRFAKDLRDEYGHRVSASDIMSNPTLAGIASLLNGPALAPTGTYADEFSSKWSKVVCSAYPTASVEYVLPPYGVQEGVLSRSAAIDTFYVQHVIVSCRIGTCISDLQRAWQIAMTRHPILRTVFFFSSELVQIILNPDQLTLPWSEEPSPVEDEVDFVEWFMTTQAPVVAKDINATLSESPAFRLLSFATQKQFLVLSIHHALYDGISLPLLFQDVEREYLGVSFQEPANACDILNHISSIDLMKAKELWLDHFRGFVWPQAITAEGSHANRSYTMHHSSQFHSKLSHLQELSATQNVTLQTVLTSTFATLAATRVYRARDVSFGIIRSGRLLPIDNAENAICPLVSVVPARVNFNSSGDVLQNIQSYTSAAVEVEHIPLGKVQNWVRPGRAVFELLFSVSIKTVFTSDVWDVIESQPPEADYALSVEVVLDPDQDRVIVQAAWKYGYLDETLVRKLIDDFEDITLDVVAGNISRHVSDLPSSAHVLLETEIKTKAEDHIEYASDPALLSELRPIVSEFLGIDSGLLTEQASFVSLGLDSIKSVGLARTLNKLGHHVRAENIMKYASLHALAYCLSSRSSLSDEGSHPAFSQAVANIRGSFTENELKLSPSDEVILFPTTTLQAGMLSQTMGSNGALYIHAFPLKIAPGVVLDDLEAAWIRVIDMFDILRTSFHFNSDQCVWAQAVHKCNTTKLVKDGFMTKEECDFKISTFLASIKPTKEAALHTPPLWLRAFVPSPRSHDTTSLLVLVMHHALYDGLSVGTLLETVQSVYRQSEISVTRTLQFHTLLPRILDQEELGASFWTQALHEFHPSYLQIRAGAYGHLPPQTASRTFFCDPILLENTLRRSAVTVQCLGQAVWGKLIAELSGSADVVFGHTVSGRSIPDAETVIGPVLNTIPCRVRLLEGVRNIELLKSIHRHNVEAMPWQHASLRSIQRKLGVSSLWDSIFVFQPLVETNTVDDTIWTFAFDTLENVEAQIQYAFAIEVTQLEAGFTLKAACRAEYMLRGDLEILLTRFQNLFENLMLGLDSFASGDIAIQVSDIQSMPASREEVIPSPIKQLIATIANIPATSFNSVTPLATLGIDSITAIQIVSRFRRAGLALGTNDIVTSRTVGDMVAKVKPWADDPPDHKPVPTLQLNSDERASVITRIGSSPESIEDIIPASSGMKWMIGAWQRSARTAFHHAFAFQLSPEVDRLKLRNAWNSLLERHPLLRSAYASASGSRDPRIVVYRPYSYPDSWTEEQALDHGGLALVVAKMKETISSPPPTKFPPTKAVFCRSFDANYLVLYLHHFQYDAWCLPFIIDDFSRLYSGSEPQSSNDLRSFLQAAGPSPENSSKQQLYWKRIFGEAFVPILFPSLLPHLPETHIRTLYTTKTAVFEASICEQRAKSLEVSLPSVILACWAQVQGTYSSSDFITLGLWQAGRSGLIDDIGKLASPCMNVVPMKILVPGRGGELEVSKLIANDLRDRSPVVVQSNLVDINQWVGACGRPLCNVVVNIIRVAPDAALEAGFMNQVEVPFYVPTEVPNESNATIDRLAITDLIQNDLIVDFAVLPKSDTIMMSIDAAAHMVDDARARELVVQWAEAVRNTLGLS